MASPFSWDWKVLILPSGFARSSAGSQNTRRRRICMFNKSLTKSGMFLVLGVIMIALPHSAVCRPLDIGDAENVSKQFHVYEQSSDDGSSSGQLSSSFRHGSKFDNHDEEVSAAAEDSSKFDFQKEILSSSSNEPDADNIKNIKSSNTDHSKNEPSLYAIHNPNNSEENIFLGGNSSMIVHVIVTSSSSTSGGSIEFDETDNHSKQDSSIIPENSFRFAVKEDEDGSLVAQPSSNSHVSTANLSTSSSSSATSTTSDEEGDFPNQKNENQGKRDRHSSEKSQLPQSFHIIDATNDDEFELKKVPKFHNETPDIFSAFYRAFSQTSSTLPSQLLSSHSSQASLAQQDKTLLLPNLSSTNETVTTFKLPPRSDFRQRPSSFQLFQQRRRLHRNRQLADKSTLASPIPNKVNNDGFHKHASSTGNASVEETARKLEFLAKKLDKAEHDQSLRGQQDKILMVSSSSSLSLITTTQVPFILPQSSSFSPSKIAVSVTHSKSVVASAVSTTKKREESEPVQQHDVVIGRVKNDAKSETSFPVSQQEREKNHGTYSYIIRPRPLIKTFSRNKDQRNDNINNKNRSSSHIFPKNFSTHAREGNGISDKTYGARGSVAGTSVNGTGKVAGEERSVNNNHNNKDNEDNFNIQDRLNIISPPREGSGSTDLPNPIPFALPRVQSPEFIEVTTFRPSAQRRKITRTVSSDIGDSSFYFNANVNYRSTPRSSPKVPVSQKPDQSTQPSTPKPVKNWQQPEQIWSEPAKIWGVPAKVWGESERVWSQPTEVWNPPENIWSKKFEDEMMQSDQPPEDRKTSNNDDNIPQQGTFVILGDDENEGDSIDGDLGRPLMLHHFSVPNNKQKETVSVSTSITSSISSNNKTINNGSSNFETGPFTINVAPHESQTHLNAHQQNVVIPFSPSSPTSNGTMSSRVTQDNSDSKTTSDYSSDPQGQHKKSGKKFGYVIEGANVRKYRVEERTPDGYIVGEYGVLNNQNAFLRGVRYTADGTINPRLIHEALMKFLSLRR